MLLDIQGNQRAVIDPLFRIVMRHEFDMLGREMQQESMDAGARWLLNDLEGNRSMRHEFDMLGREMQQESMDAGARWLLNDLEGKPIMRHEFDMLGREMQQE